MQIPKAFLILCAAVLLLPAPVPGAETDAQAKARKALEEKLKEISAGTNAPASAPATAAPAPESKPTPPAAVPVPEAAATATPAPPSSTVDPKVLEAMRQRLNELQAQSPALTNETVTAPAPTTKPPKPAPRVVQRQRTPPSSARPVPPGQQTAKPVTPPQPITPAPAAAAAASTAVTATPPPSQPAPTPAVAQPAPAPAPAAVVVPEPAPAPTPVPTTAATTPPDAQPSPSSAPNPRRPVLNMPPSAAPGDIDKAREAMRGKLATLEPPPSTTPVEATDPKRKAAENAAETVSEKPKTPKPPKPAELQKTAPVFEPLTGPPLPISDAKQQKLKDLLRLYQADQLTPEQYHQQRAKILAEP